MSIADDLVEIALEAFDLGMTASGHPCAVDKTTGRVFGMAGRATDLKAVLRGDYRTRASKTVADGHIRIAMDTLVGMAMRSTVVVEDGSGSGEDGDGGGEDLCSQFTGMPDAICIDDGDVVVVREVLRRLEGRDDIFVSGTVLVRVLRDDKGRAFLSPLAKPAELSNWCDGRMTFWEGPNKKHPGCMEMFLPDSCGRVVEARGEWPGVLRVLGMSNTPVVRLDGSIFAEDGYDPKTRLYVDLPDDLKDLGVPDVPSDAELWAAVDVILRAYEGFPFKTKADHANAVGLALTSFVFQMFPDMLVPIHIASAHAQSSGKSLACQYLPGTFAGGDAALTYTKDESELRKLITTALTDGSEKILCLDNIEKGMVFESAVLATAVIRGEWKDRILGGNRMARVAQDRIFTATGNNIEIGADLAVRSVLIELDPVGGDPAEREFDVRLDDPSVLVSVRPELVRAALVVVRSWALAGAPDARGGSPVMRQFTQWARRVGGLLEHMGVEGHLGNMDALKRTDEAAVAVGVLWEAIRQRFGAEPFTTAHVVEEVVAKRDDLDDAWPVWVSEKVVRPVGTDELSAESMAKLRRSLGNTLKNHQGRTYSELRVDSVGEGHGGYKFWKVRTVSEMTESVRDSGDSVARQT